MSAPRMLWTFALLLFMLLLPGCAGVPYERGLPQDDAPSAGLQQHVASRHPAGSQTLHRAILEVFGRQFTFNVYVLARPSGDLRCVGMDDFGGTFFDVIRRGNGVIQVVKADRGIPESWLRDGLVRDMTLLYFAVPSPGAQPVRHDNGNLGLVEEPEAGPYREFLFDGVTHQLLACVQARRSRCVYRMDFLVPTTRPAGDVQFPQVIRINDYGLTSGYRLHLEVRQRKAMPLPDHFFVADSHAK